MIRQTIIPVEANGMLTLPKEMVGKEIDVYIFQKDEPYVGNIEHNYTGWHKKLQETALQLQAIAFFEKISVDTGNIGKYRREDV